jgi:hypothetical protein
VDYSFYHQHRPAPINQREQGGAIWYVAVEVMKVLSFCAQK